MSPGKPTSDGNHGNTIQLAEGRQLGYLGYGNPGGGVLFYFHGHPGCRLEAGFLAAAADRAGVRLIGVDRPGMGLSSYQPWRQLLDWPDDLVELADHLRIDKFSVVGFSGGAPYAAACAYRIPNRLNACGLVSGAGQVSVFVAFLARWLPWLLTYTFRRYFADERHAQKSLARFARRWVQPDRNALHQPGISDLMAASLAGAFRQGARGAAYEGTLLGRQWGFDTADITLLTVHIWHGELDKQIPVSTARAVAATLTNCQATFYPDEGHISTIVNHAEEIVRSLTTDRLA
jgi:pimeloyl-ACP methyl ester carboxylesterase